MCLILALGKQRQADLYEFEASVVYRVSSTSAKDGETLSFKTPINPSSGDAHL